MFRPVCFSFLGPRKDHITIVEVCFQVFLLSAIFLCSVSLMINFTVIVTFRKVRRFSEIFGCL